MRSALSAFITTALAILGLATTAHGAAAQHCKRVTEHKIVNGELVVVVTLMCTPTESSPSDGANNADGAATLPPPLGSAACIGGAVAVGLDPVEYCFGGQEAQDLPVITGGLVARALRRMTLPASDLVIQPPGGKTLVNFATNFLTTNDQPLLRSIQLLGRQIELRIWPTSYTWIFGDGKVTTTETPGAQFPNLEVTHNYLKTGEYRPSVDTTYAAEWRVAGGQWQPVAGTATIAGEPASLEAIEARPTLVGYGG